MYEVLGKKPPVKMFLSAMTCGLKIKMKELSSTLDFHVLYLFILGKLLQCICL